MRTMLDVRSMITAIQLIEAYRDYLAPLKDFALRSQYANADALLGKDAEDIGRFVALICELDADMCKCLAHKMNRLEKAEKRGG